MELDFFLDFFIESEYRGIENMVVKSLSRLQEQFPAISARVTDLQERTDAVLIQEIDSATPIINSRFLHQQSATLLQGQGLGSETKRIESYAPTSFQSLSIHRINVINDACGVRCEDHRSIL